MASGNRRPKSWLYKRGDVYWIRFQYPPALQETACDLYGVDSWPKERAWSLRVTTMVEAEAKAAPFIADHKELLLYHAARNDDENKWAEMTPIWLMEPNTTDLLPDGTRIVATEQSIVTITPDNQVKTKPNRKLPKLNYTEYGQSTPQYKEAFAARHSANKVRDIDAEAIENYIADRKKRGKFQDDDDPNGIRRTLEDFRAINGGKTISQSSAKDVDRLIEFLMNDRQPQLSHGRTKKLLSYMRAAVNNDIAMNPAVPNFKYNLFDNFFVPNEDGSDNPIPPYSEADVKAIKANLGRFTDEQKLMLVWHISSSVRPIGLHSIRSDEWEDGENADTSETFRTRHVRILKDKGKYGPRNLPIPEAVLALKKDDGTPLLPEKIDGPLFTTPLAPLLVEINNKLERLNIHTKDDRKTLYSGRHRARDRLLNRDAPDKMSKAIMGHARIIEQHDKYGTGYAMWKMKPWIDKIGF